MKLLCLSNGHGEDAIAVRILAELQRQSPLLEIAALPLVGEGSAYLRSQVPIVGAVKQMPSGGFIYMDNKQLWRDVRGGLLQLVWKQYGAMRQWVRSSGESAVVLAVGDLVPLLFAGLSGVSYAFVGTAKSEYYLRDSERGWHSPKTRREGWAGSVYYPWERWLMSRQRCRAVFPRDSLTARILQKKGRIPIFDLGNPMMDGIEPEGSAPVFDGVNTEEQEKARSLQIVLLPGSRPPEAYRNWEQMLEAVGLVSRTFGDRGVTFLAAITPTLDANACVTPLAEQGFRAPRDAGKGWGGDREALVFERDRSKLVLTQNAYHDCLLQADFAIAMAGTATEQFVGLGKPAIALPGQGPQYTYAFAEAQSRHLGASLILVQQPREVAETIQSLLQDPDRLQFIAKNGRQRMGKPGAARRIAECLISRLG
ncbi:MAG: lipid-A-disaccharide synthase-related protein [Cyanobacteriota bacterium]|nr:lipid-A-disaccharide synthase-related protein [Cyanobacteriota bacterium]